MTLVVGLNLSDRVCLAADTRVSSGGKVIHDHQLKIKRISSWALLGAAGSEHCIAYLSAHLGEVFKISHIGEIRSRIERVLKKAISKYKKTYPDRHIKANFVFVGVDPYGKKTLPLARLHQAAKLAQEFATPTVASMLNMHLLESMSRAEAADFQARVRQGNLFLKPGILDAILSSRPGEKTVQLPYADSLVFSVEAAYDAGLNIPAAWVTDALWGDYVCIGGGVTKTDEDWQLLLQGEFSLRSIDPVEGSTCLLPVIASRFSSTIGGAVTLFVCNQSGIYAIGSNLERIRQGTNTREVMYECKMNNDGHFDVRPAGSKLWVPLKPFPELVGLAMLPGDDYSYGNVDHDW